jgi:hypothetical protein
MNMSVSNINSLVFTVETEIVYCTVGAVSLNIIQVNFRLYKAKRLFLISRGILYRISA